MPRRRDTAPTTRFSLRLTEEERRELEHRAGTLTLSAYVRQKILDCENGKRPRGENRPVKDHTDLAQVLALLGSTDAFASLAEIAKAAESGALAWDDETAATLNRATCELATIKALLMNALGVKAE